MDVIIYPCLDLSQINVDNGAPDIKRSPISYAKGTGLQLTSKSY